MDEQNKNLNEEPSKEGEPLSAMGVAKELYGWIESFAVTIAVILVIFTFFIRTAYVDGDSMNDTLIDEETLAISNFLYTPKAGDIIVFEAPDSTIVDGALVKRVIATEGQTVDIDFMNWTVTVDGEVIDEPYIRRDGIVMDPGNMKFPLTVDEGCVFVMGDNRNNSHDSRNADIGLVDTRYVFGRVLFRLAPLNKFGAIK